MMKRDTHFSKASLHRLLKDHTSCMVAEDAALETGDFLVEHGEELAEKAMQYARHADRKTIQEKDVRRARRDMEQ